MTIEKDIKADLRTELEHAWDVKVPDIFWDFASRYPSQLLPDTHFFQVQEMILQNEITVRVPPNLRPFGMRISNESLICFHTGSHHKSNHWEVVYWNLDERCLSPYASNFENYLCKHLYSTRYSLDEEGLPDIDLKFWTGLFNSLGIEANWIFDEIPINEKMMYETLSLHDSGDSLSLCQLGCILRSRGKEAEASHLFSEASKHTPWFGDAYYLMAEVMRTEGRMAQAVHEWWKILQLPVVFSTRSDSWDLGADYPDAEIYELTVDLIIGEQKHVPTPITDTPLWNALLLEDPYDPVMRENLAENYRHQSLDLALETELWDAYFLYADDDIEELLRINRKLSTLLEQQHRTYDLKQLLREQNRLLKHHEH